MLGKRPRHLPRTTSMSQLPPPPTLRTPNLHLTPPNQPPFLPNIAPLNPSGESIIVDCNNSVVDHMSPEDARHDQLLGSAQKASPSLRSTHLFVGAFPSFDRPLGKPHAPDNPIRPVDFLDSCFFCNKRLVHERDIFIYRGDIAFCSEECRHHLIRRDERASRKGKSPKGDGKVVSSETAVAA